MPALRIRQYLLLLRNPRALEVSLQLLLADTSAAGNPVTRDLAVSDHPVSERATDGELLSNFFDGKHF